jgi:hypothetical protein
MRIMRNRAIRDPAMIPRFFADPNLFSALPAQAMCTDLSSCNSFR